MSLLVVVKLATVLSVVLLLFALALRAKVSDLMYLVIHWRLGLGAFVAMFVLVPAAAFLMIYLVELPRPVVIAVAAMALSPLPPILPGKQLKAGAESCYVTGLLFGATIVSLFVVPIGLAIASRIFAVDVSISPLALLKPLAISVLIPLVLGLLAQPLFGCAVPRVSAIVSKVGTILLLLVVIAFVIILAPAFWRLAGNGTLVAFAVMAVVGLAAGYWLGGPDRGDKAALSLAASTRHPGVALAIVTQTIPNVPLVPAAVVLSLVVSTLIGIPFLHYLGRKSAGNPA
ncbi:putative Na+-dependent transporter [Novosphingobium sp. PhB165]|uniref:bile acid:sodium symporter n=1 Tax=Novosphingobium sp. PhB165 TaxID=2485105 RepID=UPI00104ED780|nr:bile acid:sodium symporter [Novosphingobium sp. PhB165]TCM20874.1 putative Na+-dependent transporter [Novosphingobium sp. PhB165]